MPEQCDWPHHDSSLKAMLMLSTPRVEQSHQGSQVLQVQKRGGLVARLSALLPHHARPHALLQTIAGISVRHLQVISMVDSGLHLHLSRKYRE